MTIYLIEDCPFKASKIVEFLLTSFPDVPKPIVFGSFQSGLKAIESMPPSLLLLDMTLPTFDRAPNRRDGRARPLGGYEIMRKMKMRLVKSTVILITQLESFSEAKRSVSFNDLSTTCEIEFPNLFAGSVYFDHGLEWQSQLTTLVRLWRSKND